MSHISIGDFKRYCKQNLHIDEVFNQIADKRKKPQIKAGKICWAIVNMVSLGIKSLLELDQVGRLSKMRGYIGAKRHMVASDATNERVLSLICVSSIREAMRQIYAGLCQQGIDKIKLETSRELSIAGIDASGFGRHLVSALSVFGKTQTALDIEPYYKKGKEPPSSYKLIRRTTRLLGKGFCDILIGDGLYRASKFFKLCKESGIDGLVKTKESRLEAIKDALGLYKNKDNTSIERISGFDYNILCEYEAKAVVCVRMGGLRHSVKVVHVKEYYPKKDLHEEFFVITTKEDLTANECRELAHKRWAIENNIFRRLNQLIKSKSVHTHNRKVLTSLLLLWYMGLNLVNVFLFKCLPGSFRKIFGMAKETFSIKISHPRLSLLSGYG